MTRYITFGDTGDGKTLLAVDFLYDAYKEGYKVFSNIKLNNMEYTKIMDTNFIEEINLKDKNAVLVDEVGTISKGYYAFNFNQLLAQSRKSIGENQIFIMTAQVKQQTDAIMRGMVDFFLYPTILNRDEQQKPIFMQVDYYVKQKNSYPLVFSPCNESIPYNLRYRYVYNTCDYYNTFEMVDPLQDGKIFEYLTIYSDYIGTVGNQKKLKTLINQKHGTSLNESERIALKIIHAKEYGLYDEWIKRNPPSNKP